MQVAFHDIVGNPCVRRITDDGWFPGEDVKSAGPVEGTAVLRRTAADQVDVTGTLTVPVEASCGRCCRDVRLVLDIEFFYRCIVGEDEAGALQEMECREEDSQTQFLTEPVVDLGALCREQVLLALPARILCCSECKGLCQQCGADLNHSLCSCQPSTDTGPFAALKRLKDNKDRNH